MFVQHQVLKPVSYLSCFCFRWNAIKSKKAKFNPKYPFLVPKSYSGVDQDDKEIKNYFAATQAKTQSHKINCQARNNSKLTNWQTFECILPRIS